MKQGSQDLNELAGKLQAQSRAKEDFIAPAQALQLVHLEEMENEELVPGWRLQLGDQDHTYDPSRLFHRQLGQFTAVPATYYDRMMKEAPGLLTDNVNHWLAKSDKKRMVRTVNGNARAFLSDRYRRLDNWDLAEVVIPIIQDMPGAKVASCELTESRMYIKVLLEDRTAEVKVNRNDHTFVNEVIRAGFAISNSEVGLGRLVVDPMIEILRCINGMIMRDSSFRQRHVGASLSDDEEIRKLLTTEAQEADDKAIFLKFRDVVKATATEVKFREMVEVIQGATEQKIEGDPVKAIEVLSQKSRLNQDEHSSVLRHLIEGGDLSKWGVMNAVTSAAQEVDDYDRATELEMLGGDIILMPKKDWSSIARATA